MVIILLYSGDGDHMTNGVNGDNTHMDDQSGEQKDQPEPVKTTKKIRVTYEEYRTISNLLILHMRQQEEADKGGWG